MKNPLTQNPVDRDIVALLAVSNLHAAEKKIWLDLLPGMTLDEKEQLKKNLEEEVMYEAEMSKEALQQFTALLEKGI